MRLPLISMLLLTLAFLAQVSCASLDFSAGADNPDADTGSDDGSLDSGIQSDFLASSWGLRGTLDVFTDGSVGIAALFVVGRDDQDSCEAAALTATAQLLGAEQPLVDGVDAWVGIDVQWTPTPGCPPLGPSNLVLGLGPTSPSLRPIAEVRGLTLDGAYGVSLWRDAAPVLLFGLAVRIGEGLDPDDTDLPDTDLQDTDLPDDTDAVPPGDTDPAAGDPPANGGDDGTPPGDTDPADPPHAGPIAPGRYKLHTLFGLPVGG